MLVAIAVDRLERESGDTRYGPTLVDFTAHVSVDDPGALVATLRELPRRA